MKINYKNDPDYKYNKGICDDSYMIWMFEEGLKYDDRKFFYDLMIEAKVECEKIKMIYEL